MTKSKTPRTDAELLANTQTDYPQGIVEAAFARTLELEIEKLKKTVLQLGEQTAVISKQAISLKDKLDASERSNAGMRDALSTTKSWIVANTNQPVHELDAYLSGVLSSASGQGYVKREVLEGACYQFQNLIDFVTENKLSDDQSKGMIDAQMALWNGQAELDRTKPQ